MKLVIDIPDNYMDYIDSYEKGSLFDMALTNAIKNGTPLEQEPITDRIEYGTDGNTYRLTISNGKELEQEPKTGHWVRHTRVESVYDIKGVKTWGIKCQCDKCNFTTIVIEDFGYYKYCPNCGARMESEE